MTTLKLYSIEPNPKQPRKDFPEEGLRELADNIKQVGLKQPLIVRPFKDGKHQLVDGERRYRACKLIPLEDVPVDIREDIKTEEEAAIQSYIMNEQRLNYNPQDKEDYIYHLKESTGLSTRKLAEKLGIHHSHIDHMLEAHRFRQRLPPTLVGTLPLTPSALKNTAMIKDDKLRIRMLQAIYDKKIKSDYETVGYISDLLAQVPQVVQEAFFLELFTTAQLAEIADLSPKDKDIVDAIMEAFSGHIPKELKRDVIYGYPYIQAALEPKLMEALIENEGERKEAWLRKYIEEHPERKKKDIIYHYKLQTEGWQDEMRDFVDWQFTEFKKKYERESRGYRHIRGVDGFWKDVYYWMMQMLSIRKTRGIEDEDLRIAIIDVVYSFDFQRALKTSVNADDIARRVNEVGEEEAGEFLNSQEKEQKN